MRPDPFRPRTWPLALKVPVQAALFTFLVAVVTTQAALTLSSEREEWLVRQGLGALAAGVAAAVAPAAPGGPEAVERVLAELSGALDEGLAGRIEVSWGEDGVLGVALPGAGEGDLAVTRAFPQAGDGVSVTVVADEGALAAARLMDQVRVAAVDLLLALVGALVALWFVRRTLAPVEALTADLLADTAGRPEATAALEPVSTEFGRLQRVMRERIAVEAERASALVRLAEQERTAGLAKLAASMAHEVRNPLAGLMNAVSTLRRFGEDAAVRAESLDLIERGLRSIDRVAGAALATYRPADGGMGFGPSDLDDLRVLVGPEARRRAVTLTWDVELSAPVEADAALMRQVLLNLLLNAVKASGEGGHTRLSARVCEGELSVEVGDTGPGLPSDVRRFLAGGQADPFPRPGALGLWTVMRLLDDIDGRLSIDSHPGRGTTVTVRVPAAAAVADAGEGEAA